MQPQYRTYPGEPRFPGLGAPLPTPGKVPGMDRGQSLAAGKHDRQRDSRHELLQGVRLKKSWLWLLAASILLSLAVPLALGGFSQFALLHRLSWWAALVLALLAFISWGFNALRTQILMGGLGRSISFTGAALTTMSAEFAGVATPGGVGMPATYTLLFHHLGITVGEAFGLVSAIVVTDLVFFALLMIMAVIGEIFSGAASPSNLKLIFLTLLILGGGTALMVTLSLNFRRVYHYVSRQMAKVPWLARRRLRLARGTVHFRRSLRTLRQMSWLSLAALLGVTFGFWLPRYMVLVVVLYLVGAQVPLAYLLLAQGLLNMGGQVFGLPGGGGTEDAAYAALLSPYLSAQPLAFSLLVWRTYNFYWFLILGAPIFLYQTGDAARNLWRRQA